MTPQKSPHVVGLFEHLTRNQGLESESTCRFSYYITMAFLILLLQQAALNLTNKSAITL